MVLPNLRPVQLPRAEVVYEEDEPINSVYFVTSGIISLMLSAQRVVEIEVGMVGPEGVAGAGAVLAGTTSFTGGTVQIEGTALRMPAQMLRDQFKVSQTLQEQVLRHVQAVAHQTVQCGVCSYFHTVEERLCRWLLMVHDRAGTDRLQLTHERMALMLGSRRSAVTLSAGTLRREGLINYSHGTITILDREGLEKCTCSCYAALRKYEFD